MESELGMHAVTTPAPVQVCGCRFKGQFQVVVRACAMTFAPQYSTRWQVGGRKKMSEAETRARRRKPQESGEQDQDAALDEVLGTAVKDPLVRTPAKPPDPSKLDEKWDLEDDEDWVEGQSPGGERAEEDAELSRRRRVLKRDSVEAGTALLVHLLFMCIYIYIHVYDATIVKKTKGKGFPGLLSYGGRWKYLTYWNLVSRVHTKS